MNNQYRKNIKNLKVKNLWGSDNFVRCYECKDYSSNNVVKFLKNLDFNTILDVGCARGGLLKVLDISHGCYTGFDISNVMIEKNKKDYSGANWCVGDVTKLPYKDNSFDVVVCSDVLIHVPFCLWQHALNECLRVANKYVLLVVRNKLGKTIYSTQEVDGYVAPYNIFGNDFWDYFVKNKFGVVPVRKKVFLNKDKCVKFLFLVWTTTILVELKEK